MKQVPIFQFILKGTGLFLVLFFISTFASAATSQDAKVNITGNNLTVKEVIRQVESQTSFLFVYSESEIDMNKKANVKGGSQAIDKCLSDAFGGSGIDYAFENGYIVLTKAESPRQSAAAQRGGPVSGVVSDTKGEPVVGASVLVKGTQNGAFSGIDGDYSLEQVPSDAILQVSCIGFETVGKGA